MLLNILFTKMNARSRKRIFFWCYWIHTACKWKLLWRIWNSQDVNDSLETLLNVYNYADILSEGVFRAIECRLAQMNVFSQYCLAFSANDCLLSLNEIQKVYVLEYTGREEAWAILWGMKFFTHLKALAQSFSHGSLALFFQLHLLCRNFVWIFSHLPSSSQNLRSVLRSLDSVIDTWQLKTSACTLNESCVKWETNDRVFVQQTDATNI